MITFSENQQKIVDRLKTERMSQAEFEQYAKEHGYIICTTNIIEQIRDEIEQLVDNTEILGGLVDGREVIKILDKHIGGKA